MKPGGTALTVIPPTGPYSSASDFVSPLTADLAATYGAMKGWPECVLDDEMLTMRPPQPASIMSGSTAWTQWKTPLRLTSMTRCQRSNEVSRNLPKLSRPAALTRMETGQLGADGVHRLVDGGPVGDVGHERVRRVRRVEIEDGDVVPVGAESVRDGQPDPGPAAGHDSILHLQSLLICGRDLKNQPSDYENRTLGQVDHAR